MIARNVAKRLVKHVIPAAYLIRRDVSLNAQKLWEGGEPEIRLLPFLCEKSKIAVDVGGNDGSYTYHLRRLARHCYVFEPIPDLAKRLSAAFASDGNVTVCSVALSGEGGSSELRVPQLNGPVAGLATLERENVLSGLPYTSLLVEKCRLDSYELADVGFIKIDVEGHELATLRGAVLTLELNRPNLLVEAEERHRTNAVGSLIDFLAPFGYRGMFLLNGELHDIETFDVSTHQRSEAVDIARKVFGATYINNFIFSSDREAIRSKFHANRSA